MKYEITLFYKLPFEEWKIFIDVPTYELAQQMAESFISEDDADYFALMMCPLD